MTHEAAARIVGRARSHFYLPMRLAGPRQRQAMYAVYAFARTVDDISDGSAPAVEKRMALASWRHEIDSIYRRGASTPLGRDLAPFVNEFALPRAEFDALLDGMDMDVDGPIVAPDAQTLHRYCRNVAGSIGVLVLHILGPVGPAEIRLAESLGRAVQLTNVLRDVHADAAQGRLYVPRELLDREGIRADHPRRIIDAPGFADACRALAAQAEAAFADAAAAARSCQHPRGLQPVLLIHAIYRRLLHEVVRRQFPARQVRLNRLTQAAVVLRTLVTGQA